MKGNALAAASLLAFCALSGCGREERDRLSRENKALADRVRALEAENVRLKKPADRRAPSGGAEKHHPKTPPEAVAEWKEFRSRERENRGRVTTWQFSVAGFDGGSPFGFLDGPDEHGGREYRVDLRRVATKDLFALHERDWIVVTGRFELVGAKNSIVLSALRFKNVGYKP